jgi:hypothetical protein
MPKLTKRYIESIKPPPARDHTMWDSELKGFGVVVMPSVRCTYVIQYRNTANTKKRLKLGVYGHITIEEARELAKKRVNAHFKILKRIINQKYEIFYY